MHGGAGAQKIGEIHSPSAPLARNTAWTRRLPYSDRLADPGRSVDLFSDICVLGPRTDRQELYEEIAQDLWTRGSTPHPAALTLILDHLRAVPEADRLDHLRQIRNHLFVSGQPDLRIRTQELKGMLELAKLLDSTPDSLFRDPRQVDPLWRAEVMEMVLEATKRLAPRWRAEFVRETVPAILGAHPELEPARLREAFAAAAAYNQTDADWPFDAKRLRAPRRPGRVGEAAGGESSIYGAEAIEAERRDSYIRRFIAQEAHIGLERWALTSTPLKSYCHARYSVFKTQRPDFLLYLREQLARGPLRVLDIGAGSGEQWLEVMGEENLQLWLTGLHPRWMEARVRDRTIACTAAELPGFFAPGSFDLIVSHYGTHGQNRQAHEAILHLLAPGGEAMVSGEHDSAQDFFIEKPERFQTLAHDFQEGRRTFFYHIRKGLGD